ncbi:MAG TPA: hypothetical protein VH092_10830, partial [Urbifossiella sp.]|nr:hypothetical protein [Urbifossiella sp.]
PAEGVVEYQNFIVDPGFTEDVWVRAAEVRPGDRRVVHHCNIFLSPPGAGSNDDIHQTGELGSANLIAFTPGSGPVRLPDGLAKRIPAGWRLQFNIHYTPIGTPQSDRTEVGLLFLPAEKVRKEVATRLLQDLELEIPPHAANHRVDHAWTADRDYLLLSMFAHMHLRGKSFRYTAEYPDGSTEVLLDIPAYDFNWQHRYVLEEPKRLPAGTVLRCTAVYDNSAGNPANPDPSATVRSGLQTWEEMFNGYYDIVLADQDMPAERAAAQTQRVGSQAVLLAASGLAVLWGWRMTRGRGRPSPPGGPASVVTGPPS